MAIGTDLAFPVVGDEPRVGCDGLNKREYIAAMAMQGILAAGHLMPNESREVAERAVANADALLAELAK